MRDLLTFLAGIVILALVAALAVPPFVDWRSQREYVDTVLSRGTGLLIRTDGAIDVRFLPTPRLRLERLRIGAAGSEDASLDAQAVEAEIGLTPLLSGEVRFLESRVRRMELKLPTGTGGDWRVPRSLMSEETLGRAWVFEDLAIGQLLLTTVDPRTGRTDQVYAEQVRLQSQSMAGPWRAEGRVDSTRFTLATGELALPGPTNVKLSAEGENQARLNIDARMFLDAASEPVLVPRFEGTARLTGLREHAPLPYTASASFKTAGRLAKLENLAVELGEGGPTLRLTGEGQLALDERRLNLVLEGRRLDLDGLLAAYREAEPERRNAWRPLPNFPAELSLKLDGVALGGEELTGLTARGVLSAGRATIEALDFTAPGQTRVRSSGEASLQGGGLSGRVSLSTRSADRLLAYLARLGVADLPTERLAGLPLEASGDVVVADPIASLRNLQVRLGQATLTGAVRYTGAEFLGRPRVDAQLAIQGLDLETIPQLAGLFDGGRGIDLGLILDARNVGYGTGERGGRIAARLASEGSGLTIDLLEIADLAGANASLRGRIAPDGTGQIGGRLRARRAAPLVDLIGRASLGGVADLVPSFLREAPLDASVQVSRASGAAGSEPALVTRVNGSAAGGDLEAEIASSEGRLTELAAKLSTQEASAWLGGARLARPARLELSGKRETSGRLALSLSGDVAGTRIATAQPFGLSARDDAVESGEARLSSPDIAPLLSAIGQRVAGPVNLELAARIGRREGEPRVQLTGQVGNNPLEADLSGVSPRELSGSVTVGRLSLPWLASVTALGTVPAAAAGSIWPTARFPNQPDRPVGGTIAIKAGAADLGRGLMAQGAEFSFATTSDGFAIRDFSAAFLGGRLSGTLSLNRQGGLAAVIGEGAVAGISLPDLVGPPVRQGRLSGSLRFGGSGESLAGLISNLGGAGTAEFENLELPGADPSGIARAVQRALRSDDTLVPARLQAITAEELDKAPIKVAKASGQATFVSGGLRISPLVADAGSATWQGSVGIDLRAMAVDIRGALTAKDLPRNWSGPAPYVTLGWAGPLGRAGRTLDIGPLSNGLASVVLTRELDRIDTFELDAAERKRVNSRVEMDRARRAAAEEAARLARLREEAERARQREEAERARQREEAERARLDAEQIMGGARVPESNPARAPILAPPVEIRPPAQGGAGG